MRPTLEEESVNCETVTPAIGPWPSRGPLIALLSADATSITSRSGPASRKTVKTGGLLALTTTFAPVDVGSSRSSPSTLRSEAWAGPAANSARQAINVSRLQELIPGLSGPASIGFSRRKVGLQLWKLLALDREGDGVGGGLPVGGREVLGDHHRIAHDLRHLPALASHPGVPANEV